MRGKGLWFHCNTNFLYFFPGQWRWASAGTPELGDKNRAAQWAALGKIKNLSAG